MYGSGLWLNLRLRELVFLLLIPGILGWGKEGHYAICKIAEVSISITYATVFFFFFYYNDLNSLKAIRFVKILRTNIIREVIFHPPCVTIDLFFFFYPPSAKKKKNSHLVYDKCFRMHL